MRRPVILPPVVDHLARDLVRCAEVRGVHGRLIKRQTSREFLLILAIPLTEAVTSRASKS